MPKGVMELLQVGKASWPTLSSYLQFEAEGGSRVEFQQGRWCSNNSLAMCYLDLFSICREKEASVSDLMQSTNGRYSFGMSISQEPCRIGSWESQSNFMDVLMVYQYKEVGDRFIWSLLGDAKDC